MIRKFKVVKEYEDKKEGDIVESINLVEQAKMKRKGQWKPYVKIDPEVKNRLDKSDKGAKKRKKK